MRALVLPSSLARLSVGLWAPSSVWALAGLPVGVPVPLACVSVWVSVSSSALVMLASLLSRSLASVLVLVPMPPSTLARSLAGISMWVLVLSSALVSLSVRVLVLPSSSARSLACVPVPPRRRRWSLPWVCRWSCCWSRR